MIKPGDMVQILGVPVSTGTQPLYRGPEHVYQHGSNADHVVAHVRLHELGLVLMVTKDKDPSALALFQGRLGWQSIHLFREVA